MGDQQNGSHPQPGAPSEGSQALADGTLHGATLAGVSPLASDGRVGPAEKFL
jgi:hypothetical protein